MLYFCNIDIKGGENIKKLNNRLLVISVLLVSLLITLSCVSAAENLTDLGSDEILTASNSVNIHVADSYEPVNNTWIEEGFDARGVNVSVFDSSNTLVFSGITDNGGNLVISNLGSQKYTIELRYSTYEPYIQDIDLSSQNSISLNHVFVPDILLLVDYNSHNEKVDVLMNMSRRVAYISTTQFDKTKEWLFEYAEYIHLDMFAEGSYNVLTGAYLKELLAMSPANANYMVAYTFGIYLDSILNATNMHIIGASKDNNTFHTIENTYIGSYFQAQDIFESDILQSNMKNYLNYVSYLLNPSDYRNPTLDGNNAPLLSPECGFYHPDLGLYTIYPDGAQINQWIIENPGYNADGEGSLNWMVENYPKWLEEVLNPTVLFKIFENNYLGNKSADKPFIAIATYYYGGSLVDALIREYEANGRPAFNIFKTGTHPSMSSLLNRISQSSVVGISLITSLYSWSLNYANGSAEGDLSQIDKTILKGVYDIAQSSYESELGPQMEWTYAVTFPSFEGVFGPVILSYVDGNGKSHVIQTGVEKIVKLSCQWADLKDLNNSDKKISIVLYNYPPGKAEIGASYLDVFSSTYDLLFKLGEAGYDIGNVDDIPSLLNLTDMIINFGNKGVWAQGLLNEYVEKNWDTLMQHNQLISLDEFYELTSDLNPELYKQLIDYWGDGLGNIMVYNNSYIVIPGIWFGNVFITFQPSRGWEEVKNYHDLTLPPHQQYVAFYEWLDKVVGVNAIINMGTHGTLEWLPGKNIGVMDGDWTFELTLTPTIYPYIVSNPGEAMVARDRIAALMITHMTPAMVSSELYGNYTKLLDYIAHYKDQVKLNVSSNAEEYKQLIIELAPQLGFTNQSENQTFNDWIDELHIYLDDMQDDFYTYGLHTIGKVLTGWELIEEVCTVVSSQTKIYDYILAYLYPNLASKSFFDDINGNLEYLEVANVVKSFLKEIVTCLVNGSSVDELCSQYLIAANSSLYNSTVYASQVIVNVENNNEWDAIIAALEGDYLLAGLFADPAYGDSIPTGYDGYASDSTKMPSKSAYNSAIKVVDLLLANYYEEHGKWPELTSLILWGTEISRTEGIGIAEFLYFLGCKPVWADNGKVIGVERIALEDLTVTLNNGSIVQRPRIDVFASIVTSNKDWLSWMLTAIQLTYNASGEDASNNYIFKHYLENPTLDRLFGLPGAILEGTGMSTFIPNTADWNITSVNEQAADIYLNKVSYSWTLDENGNIVVTKQRENYEYLLSKTDLITQNFDSTWRFIDSDDYYDWFGGLYNAARNLGSNPDTAFVDIRNQNNYISRTYDEELEFEIRSMILNPNYYNSLIGSAAGYNSYSARMQNLYGGLIVAGSSLGSELGNQIASTYNGLSSGVSSVGQAAAWQSMAAWMVYLADQGVWQNPDSSQLQQLADNIIQNAIQYGVACCHHTCKNLNFNSRIIQMSSLTPQQKKDYADILAQATLTEPLYDMPEDSQSDSGSDDGQQSSEVLVNGTDDSLSSQSSDGGATAVGDDYSRDPSDASNQASAQQAGRGSAGSKSYEIQKKSASKSISGESSMPIFVIIAVIILIAVFYVGYSRNKVDDDY